MTSAIAVLEVGLLVANLGLLAITLKLYTEVLKDQKADRRSLRDQVAKMLGHGQR